jgi:hypothetical protein
MKKIKLQLDALRVESYETLRGSEAAGGTVHAHDFTRLGDRTCGGISCDYDCVTYYEHTCGEECVW